MILKHSTINLKFCNSLNSQHFQNCVKTEQHSCEDLMVMTFALQKLLRNRTIFRTLLRKAVCDRRIFLCGSLVKAFCYAKRSIVKILLRKTAYSELCFAKWLRHRIYLCGSLASAVFAVFDRHIFFGVHTCAVSTSQFKCAHLAKTTLRLVKSQIILQKCRLTTNIIYCNTY